MFGIQTGVAIGFFVREKAKLGNCEIHYSRREDEELAVDKRAYLGKAALDDVEFTRITPDSKQNWLNHSQSDFERLLPIANRETKLAKRKEDEQAMFSLYSLGVITARDEWVYDFNDNELAKKVQTFIAHYEDARASHGGKNLDVDELGTYIKWTRDLKRQIFLNRPNTFDADCIRTCMFRPFVNRALYFSQPLNEMQYQLPTVFPSQPPQANSVITFSGPGSTKPFAALAANGIYCYDMLEKTQCLPLYRYTEDGERVSNITDWGLRQINDHYRKTWGKDFAEEFPNGITAEHIFAYTYAVLHDPVYRHDYQIDLKQEFPRLPLYKDFSAWARMGQELLDLHIGFESADPYPLKRVDTGVEAKRTILRADKDNGRIILDDVTTLTGVPADAWRYRLGNRSALEWVLDQYKERNPKDPTIAEKFNTYKFADYKEQVIDLLRRVCTVSVRTMDIVDDMAYWDGDNLVVFGDRDKMEWSLMGLHAIFSHPEDPEWEAAWSET